jgi:hypothetical protein
MAITLATMAVMATRVTAHPIELLRFMESSR